MIEKLGFTSRIPRDNQYHDLKAEGKKHVVRYTTHEKMTVRRMVDGKEQEFEKYNPQIIYVVAWDEPATKGTTV